jgi:hypothetical protein
MKIRLEGFPGSPTATRDRALAPYTARPNRGGRSNLTGSAPPGRLALQLDSDTNNTSRRLRRAGRRSHSVVPRRRAGRQLAVVAVDVVVDRGRAHVTRRHARELLERTVLYKVGHGSHNATLREFGLEMMSSPELTAMVPVNARRRKMDWKMPSRRQDAAAGKDQGPGTDRDNGLAQPDGPARARLASGRSCRARRRPAVVDRDYLATARRPRRPSDTRSPTVARSLICGPLPM